MEKIKYRSVTEFLFLKGFITKQIHERLLELYKDSSSSLGTVYNCYAEFNCICTSLKDNPHSAPTSELVQKVYRFR